MAVVASQRLVESFLDQNHHVNCVEITDLDKASGGMKMAIYFLLKAGAFRCFHRATRFAREACAQMGASCAEKPAETPLPPVSCAAELAQRMGASELQVVMAAGLAGGIGLSGGACGALGAAIWLVGLKSLEDGAATVDENNPEAGHAIERFMGCTDYKFECAEIVGRRFEDIHDHAQHLRAGGCARLIEELVTGMSAG